MFSSQRRSSQRKKRISTVIGLITRNVACMHLALVSCQLRGFRFSCNYIEDVTRCLYDCRNISRVPKVDLDEEASVVVSGTVFTAADGTGIAFNV